MNKNGNLIPFKKGHKRIMPDPEKQEAKKNLKKMLTEFSEERFDDFVDEFRKLRGKPKCDIYIKILEFVQPRISSIAFEDLKEASSAVQLLKDFAKYRKDEEN